MKIKLLFLVGFAALGSFSQESTEIPDVIQVYDWSVNAGISYDYVAVGSRADFDVLAPDAGLSSIIFPPDYDEDVWFGAVYFNPTLSSSVGIRFYSKKNGRYFKMPSVRVGLNYSRINALSGRIWYGSETTVDTLVSSTTGQSYYLDSIVRESYWMKYSANLIRLDLSCLFRFNADGRWSFYTGLALSGGFSLFPKTKIEHRAFVETQLQKEDESQFVIGLSVFEDYKQRNKIGINAAWYIPLGIDFRLGNNGDFSKRAHFFYELEPGINVVSIPELRTIQTTNFQQSLGFRLEL